MSCRGTLQRPPRRLQVARVRAADAQRAVQAPGPAQAKPIRDDIDEADTVERYRPAPPARRPAPTHDHVPERLTGTRPLPRGGAARPGHQLRRDDGGARPPVRQAGRRRRRRRRRHQLGRGGRSVGTWQRLVWTDRLSNAAGGGAGPRASARAGVCRGAGGGRCGQRRGRGGAAGH